LLNLRKLSKDANIDDVIQRFTALHKKITATDPQHLLVSDPSNIAQAQKALQDQWASQANSKESGLMQLEFEAHQVKEAWVVPTQANFCAKAYPTVCANHDDSPALSVLGVFLRNGFLHTAIREQGGAYGGGASQDSSIGVFKFYSYRDPRIKGTFEDFDRSIDWFKNTEHDAEALEQSILGVVSSIDKPSSPAGEAKQAFHNNLQGRDINWRNAYRQKILNVTMSDLHRVVNAYFDPALASTGAVISAQNKQEAQALGMTIFEI
jgi:Zn-dependent M16 (insulinase) family peptidase